MIRLNDINKTVIDEKKMNMYMGRQYTNYDTDTPTFEKIYELYISNERIGITIQYETKELRDKDIELLDKLFEVKSIEYKAKSQAKPELTGKCVKEEYLTWYDVKQSENPIKAKLPNGDIKMICYDDEDDDIIIESYTHREARIYDEDLFNALMLKRVE